MKICVPVKWVIDSIKPVQAAADGRHIQTESGKMHMDPLSAVALSKAIDFKTARLADSVIAVTVGDSQTEPVLRTALAMGADTVVRINVHSQSAFQTASVIADFVQHNHIKMILCGNRSSDSASGQMGAMLAGFLQYPYVSRATYITWEQNDISVISGFNNTQVTYTHYLPIVIGCDVHVTTAHMPSLPRKLYVKNRHIPHLTIGKIPPPSVQVVQYQSAMSPENTAQKITAQQLVEMLQQENPA